MRSSDLKTPQPLPGDLPWHPTHLHLLESPVNTRVLKSTHLDSNPGFFSLSSLARVDDSTPLSLSFLTCASVSQSSSSGPSSESSEGSLRSSVTHLGQHLAQRRERRELTRPLGEILLQINGGPAEERAGVLRPVHHGAPRGSNDKPERPVAGYLFGHPSDLL